jgi:hypothetical protein
MTSIEWLFDYVAAQEVGNYRIILDTRDLEEAYEEAKEMHKQEIINAHNSGFEKSEEGWNGEYGLMDMNNISEEIESERYYQETFKKD